MLRKYIAKLIFLFFISHNLFANTTDYEKAHKLIDAYPNHLLAYKDNYIIWKNKEKILFDDLKEKNSYKELLNNASLKNQLHIEYIKVTHKEHHKPLKNEDPGRVRNEEFFRKMYGATKDKIKKNLVQIKWMPKTTNKTLYVTTVNNVHKKLQNISKELDQLPKKLKKFVHQPAGTYKYRKIAGTNRLSMHSFGMAIDINIKKSHYWKWDKNRNKFEYKNLIPMKIVKIFEKYGFIWGGRWYHYDTMHFEYRPELLN